MGRLLLRIVLTRGLLIAAPFVVWFIWRAWARRTGREMGSTPYGWLFGAGAILVGLSLMGSVFLRPDHRRDRYVPGEVTASGAVSKGHFEPQAPPR
jgi:hypothetical protein